MVPPDLQAHERFAPEKLYQGQDPLHEHGTGARSDDMQTYMYAMSKAALS